MSFQTSKTCKVLISNFILVFKNDFYKIGSFVKKSTEIKCKKCDFLTNCIRVEKSKFFLKLLMRKTK